MLTDEMRADGWIEHDGGPCPEIIPRVKVMWESGLTNIGFAKPSWWDSWDRPARVNHPRKWMGRIIAYKPESHHG